MSLPRLALSIRQPWAELVMSGIKTIEVRSRSTRIRGPVFVYAALSTAKGPDADAASTRYRLDVTTLPAGVLVGVVEIVDARELRAEDADDACLDASARSGYFAWRLAGPVRLPKPRRPSRRPQPVFFRPFE